MRTYNEASGAFDDWMNTFQIGRARRQTVETPETAAKAPAPVMVSGIEAVDLFLETYDKYDDHRIALLTERGENEYQASAAKWSAAKKKVGA